MNDIETILLIGLFSYLFEYMQIQLNFSVLKIFLFINIIGLYYIFRKIRFNIVIEYNH